MQAHYIFTRNPRAWANIQPGAGMKSSKVPTHTIACSTSFTLPKSISRIPSIPIFSSLSDPKEPADEKSTKLSSSQNWQLQLSCRSIQFEDSKVPQLEEQRLGDPHHYLLQAPPEPASAHERANSIFFCESSNLFEIWRKQQGDAGVARLLTKYQQFALCVEVGLHIFLE